MLVGGKYLQVGREKAKRQRFKKLGVVGLGRAFGGWYSHVVTGQTIGT